MDARKELNPPAEPGGKFVKTWDDPARFEQEHTHLACATAALGGIIVAGMIYPACLFLVAIMPQMQSIRIGPAEFLILFVMALFGGATVGSLVSMVTGLLSIIIVHAINRSLGYPLNELSASISAGSMAGYMPTVAVVFLVGASGRVPDILMAGVIGPLLAMCLGAAGAAWGAKRWGGFDLSNLPSRQHKLSVFHMLMATMWISITFAVANAFGGPEFGIAAAAWFVLQGLMLAARSMLLRK